MIIDTKELYDKLSYDLTVGKYKDIECISFDTETTDLSISKLDIVGYSFAFRKGKEILSFYVPIGHKSKESYTLFESTKVINLERFYAFEILDFLMTKKVIMHNAVFDMLVLKKFNIILPDIESDTMILSKLINENLPGSLKKLVSYYLNYNMVTFKYLTKNKNIQQANIEDVGKYACDDAKYTYLLYEKLINNIKNNKKEEKLILDYWNKIEKKIIYYLVDLIFKGSSVDIVFLKKLKAESQKNINDLYNKIIKQSGKEFNIKSSNQLRDFLLNDLNLVIPEEYRTKKGKESTDKEVITLLYKVYKLPILKDILDYKLNEKIISTYTDSLIKKTNNNIIHCNIRSLGADTGRMISSDPNLQNLPPVVKKFIIADKDCKLIDVDYSQIELRLLAHYSQDELMIKTYQEDGDIHLATQKACKCSNRKMAKAINFGISYGMGAKSLARKINQSMDNLEEFISLKEATKYLEAFKENYWGIFRFKKSVEKYYIKNFEIQSMYGRKRRIPKEEYLSEKFKVLRKAFNSVIQSSAADILKIAFIKVSEFLKSFNDERLRILLTIHDELLINVPIEYLYIKDKIIHIMENVTKLSIPLKIDCTEGDNWYECKH